MRDAVRRAPMLDSAWTIKDRTGNTIIGRHFQSGKKPSDKLVVFVHGLPGDFTSYPNYMAACEFANMGYDSLVFSLYGWSDAEKKLKDCTIKVFAQTVEAVLEKKAKKYKKVFLVGHSYGGPTILHVKSKKITAVSLWDPSYNMAMWWKDWAVRKGSLIIGPGAYDMVIPPRLHREAMSFDIEKCRKLGGEYEAPLQVIHAEKGLLYEVKESYHSYHGDISSYHVVRGADHSFTRHKWLHEVVSVTHDWFRKF